VLRIRDVYPGSRIPDPKTATKERGEKNILEYIFLVATSFTKFQKSYFFEMLKKKFRLVFKDGFGILDPGSAKNLSRIQVQGSKRH
jgi:hypothetical protein